MIKRFLRAFPLFWVAAMLLVPGENAQAKGLIGGTYTLNWTQDVTRKLENKDTRTFLQSLDTRYSGFLSPVVGNEISVKIDYENNSETPSAIRIYPTATLTYKGSYWNAGSKRTITREPNVNQTVLDSHFVEMYYLPLRFGLPDFKGKYTADTDVQSGKTDKFKQVVTLSSKYRPVEWFTLSGEYSWSSDNERYREPGADISSLTPVIKEEKYSFTPGIRHFFSDKLKISSEWKSEFTRGASFLDNGTAKADMGKEDQSHTWKNTLAFRPFANTSIDASLDYDMKQNMLGKNDPLLGELKDHTVNTNSKVTVTQKVGRPLEIKGEFSRTRADVRHTNAPTTKIDDAWSAEIKGDFAKQLNLIAKYTDHNISENAPGFVPKLTGSLARSLTWTGELLPVWKPSVSYDKTDSYDFDLTRGKFLKNIDTKYAIKSPIDFKKLQLAIEPSYDIGIKRDFTNIDPAFQETTSTRDFKIKVGKMLLVTRTVEAKVEHTYDRKVERGHLDGTLNNVARTDSSTASIAIKDILPNYAAGFDFTRSATDTSGDADPVDVLENFALKVDYKFERFGWNVSYLYDRNLRADKVNKWTFDAKTTWMGNNWDVALTYNQTKILSAVLDEEYKVSLDFKYNY